MTRIQAITTARQMWDNGNSGWTVGAIRRDLANHGHPVSWSRVKCWVDEDYATEYRERDRIRSRVRDRDKYGATRFLVLDNDARRRLGLDVVAEPPSKLTPDLLLALRVEDGLPYRSIAAVARRFFGEDLTPEGWRYRLHELGAPKNPNKARLAREERRAA
jgi:hypothetical protein